MTLIDTIIEGISDNLKTLVVIGGGYIAGVESGVIGGGYPAFPTLPEWWQLAGISAGLVAVVGWVVGGKIADLLPDPPGHYIVAQEAHDAQGGEIWELNDAAWQDLEVVEGELYEWTSSAWDVYEARRFNADTMTAVANWKGTEPASELSSHTETDEVMRQIRTLRNEHEQQARYGEAIRNALPVLLRTLDKWRAKDLNSALEGHISPNLGERSIDEMLQSELPDEVLPGYLQDDEERDESPGTDAVEAIEILDDGEALEPLENPPTPDDPLLNDGGSE